MYNTNGLLDKYKFSVRNKYPLVVCIVFVKHNKKCIRNKKNNKLNQNKRIK